MQTLTLGLSPCPNDTFIFHALLSGIVSAEGLSFRPVFADVEELNQRLLAGELDVSKVSFHALGHAREDCVLLDAGAALGRGCGPLLVSRPEKLAVPLAEQRIAIPGKLTSAALLLRLHAPELDPSRLVVMTFERILAAVASGEVDSGLIIHESRFTYASHGLVSRVDLGAWWEEEHGRPIPLGGIAARRRLGPDAIRRIDGALKRSVLHAREHPEASRDFVRSHAQELDDAVIAAHIGLYVNDFSVDLGREGREAIALLFAEAEEKGVIPRAARSR